MCWHYFIISIQKALRYFEVRYNFYLDSSQSRWGFVAVLSTMSFSFVALAISLIAIFLSITFNFGGRIVLSGFAIALLVVALTLGLIGLAGIVFTFMVGIYLVKDTFHPTIEESLVSLNQKADTHTKTLSNISQTLKDIKSTTKNIDRKISKHKT